MKESIMKKVLCIMDSDVLVQTLRFLESMITRKVTSNTGHPETPFAVINRPCSYITELSIRMALKGLGLWLVT